MPEPATEIGLKSVKIDRLKLPGNWREILASTEAKECGESIAKVGLIHNPVVRKSDKLLICGAHRVAGVKLQGESEIVVKLVECSDEQVKAMRIDENAERVHDPAKKQSLRAKRMAELTIEAALNPKRDEKGHLITPKTVARKELAQELGITQKSLRQAQWRDRKRLAEQVASENKPPVSTRGMEIDSEYLIEIAMVKKNLEMAKKKVGGALQNIAHITQLGIPFSEAASTRLCERLTLVVVEILAEIPKSVCPYCRCLGGIVENCEPCKCTGWVTAKTLKEAPAVLLDDETPRVVFREEVIFVSDYIGEPVEEEPGKDDEGDLAELWA